MKRKFLTLIAAVAAAMALALSAGAEAATPETAGSLTPLMPMFDTADTGIAEYSGDIVQEDAATYDASYNANEDVAANERDVYNYLTGTMGMNSAAASGVMASMYRESRFYVDITNDYGTAYGLCQWYGDRWTNLQNYCNNNGLDWHTLYGQMRFLEYELNSLSSLRSYMYGISNDANGAYHAGYNGAACMNWAATPLIPPAAIPAERWRAIPSGPSTRTAAPAAIPAGAARTAAITGTRTV